MKKDEEKKDDGKKGKGKAETGKNTRKARDKYFWQILYFNTIPAIRAELETLVAKADLTDFRMLRRHPLYQNKVTQQTMQNIMILYFVEVLEKDGIDEFERLLKRALPRLDELVAKELKVRDAIEKKGAESGGKTRPKGEGQGFTENQGPDETPGPRIRRPKR